MTTTPAAATVDLYTRPHAELANLLTEGIPTGSDIGAFRFGPDAVGKYWIVDTWEAAIVKPRSESEMGRITERGTFTRSLRVTEAPAS
ncbi:MAG: hypothetical protein EOO27_06375 [Comamonadaceae bacterium]|nr:MAG: hypothetical protein EOO27_06375 [Comamonadaceae bacterium]